MPRWPVLRRYDAEHLQRIALPLGGIGTGTVSLGGRGDLRDWEVVNRPAKGFSPNNAFFAVWTRTGGTRALEGPIPADEYDGSEGSPAPNHGLPRFRHCEFLAAYPLGQVLLSDPDMPVSVRIQAFNPFSPPDADASGIPVAVLRFVLRNKTHRRLDVAVCGSLQNFIGKDGSEGKPQRNVNEFRPGGVFLRSKGVSPDAEQFGTMALTTTARKGVTYRTAWINSDWGTGLFDFWDDFSADGRLEERASGGVDDPTASLAVRFSVPARGEKSVTFMLTWHFPNRKTWLLRKKCRYRDNAETIGNYYTTRYRDAWDVATQVAPRLPELERQTVDFVQTFCSSDLPAVVKEAALFNLSTLRSQTTFRTPDGHFFGYEGCSDKSGCCAGSCTHVWNYESATAFLFAPLARSMREVEFLHATGRDGLMCFRTKLPLSRARIWIVAAADGQMGCLMKLYREWKLSGDDDWLRRLWPRARRALEFCWIPGGWDADQDGVMEGCQHNTMDVEYYGPNPQMTGWYLGALRAGEEMAQYLGEETFAKKCRSLFEQGRDWMDANLFNGEYYEHRIRMPSKIAPGLQAGMSPLENGRPQFQLGPGCLVDQLVGQSIAHLCGLGRLHDPVRIRKTLASIYRHNFKSDLTDRFNHLRSFALNDEAALLMCTYPRGGRPRVPFPYCNEVMTGFEYTAAVGMLQEGMTAQALRCFKAVRDRFDGRKRNPFEEPECGHHYARSMASWGAVLALTGFHYDAASKTVTFKAQPGTQFWSNGSAWGTFQQRGSSVTLRVRGGRLSLAVIKLTGSWEARLSSPRVLSAGQSVRFTRPAAPAHRTGRS